MQTIYEVTVYRCYNCSLPTLHFKECIGKMSQSYRVLWNTGSRRVAWEKPDHCPGSTPPTPIWPCDHKRRKTL